MLPCHIFLDVFLDVYEGGKKSYVVKETFLSITFDSSWRYISFDLQISFPSKPGINSISEISAIQDRTGFI